MNLHEQMVLPLAEGEEDLILVGGDTPPNVVGVDDLTIEVDLDAIIRPKMKGEVTGCVRGDRAVKIVGGTWSVKDVIDHSVRPFGLR